MTTLQRVATTCGLLLLTSCSLQTMTLRVRNDGSQQLKAVYVRIASTDLGREDVIESAPPPPGVLLAFESIAPGDSAAKEYQYFGEATIAIKIVDSSGAERVYGSLYLVDKLSATYVVSIGDDHATVLD